MPITIKVNKDGPYLISAEDAKQIAIVDWEGNPVPIPEGKPNVKLCRCGASTKKPFCDGMHSKIGFRGAEEARNEFDQKAPGGPGA